MKKGLFKKRCKAYNTPSPILLRADILAEARALGIPEGFAITIAESVAESLEAYLVDHPVLTALDVHRLVVSELQKYHPDLAYIYHNRDKII